MNSHQPELSISIPNSVSLPHTLRKIWAGIKLGKVGLFIVSVFLFVLAIALMKEGVRDLVPILHNSFALTNTANSLGFGWLFAYLIMSGSPVAAVALTLLDAGVIDTLSAFAMITGSRLGASFIVLFIGFIYVLRGHDRSTGLSMGLLSLIVTGTTYLVSLIVGIGMLQLELFDTVRLPSGILLNSIINRGLDYIIRFLLTLLPTWLLFGVGLGLILISFNLFDRCLPQMTIRESQVGQVSRLVYRPWVMFGLGAVVTLISMSVSISLALLVPLSERGFIRRENVIPYIMGANITTFIDTLLAALLVSNPSAFTVVLVQMLSITLVSILILGAVFRRYERAMLALVSWLTAEKRHIIIFLGLILIIPFTLIMI